MPNNVFANIPAAVVAKATISFAAAGLDATKLRIIYEVGNPLKSYVPGRAINSITGITFNKGYYMWPLVDLDLTAIFVPPVGEGGSGGLGIGAMTIGSSFVVG